MIKELYIVSNVQEGFFFLSFQNNFSLCQTDQTVPSLVLTWIVTITISIFSPETTGPIFVEMLRDGAQNVFKTWIIYSSAHNAILK